MAATITVLTGGEELLVQRATQAVITQAGKLADEVVVRELGANALDDNAWDELLAPSLFSTATVIVVTSLADPAPGCTQQLQQLGKQPLPQVRLVLHQKANAGKKLVEGLSKLPQVDVVACAPIKTRRDRLTFLKEELRQHRRRATDTALEYLHDAVGADLYALASAVAQLVSDTTGMIELETVQRYYTGRAEVSGFAVADQVMHGHPGPALEQLRWALQSGTDPVLIASALASALRMLVAVASAPAGLKPAELASNVGVPAWKVDQLRRQVRGWTPNHIAEAMRTVFHADAAIKGAGTDPAYALEHAVVHVCTLRQGARG